MPEREEAPRDLSIPYALGLQALDDAYALGTKATTTGTPTGSRGKGSHAPGLVTALMPSHSAFGAPERDRDLPLCGVAGVYQEDHRVRLGDGIVGVVVM